jgi:hypothetical protein
MMASTDLTGRPLTESGGVWFVLSAVGSVGGGWLARQAVSSATVVTGHVTSADWMRLLAGLASILVAGCAAWMLARAGLYAWLLPLAALNLVLLEPGRAGDVATWRLEWGVMGLVWTLAAVAVFAHLLWRSDELERRLHLEGASLALAVGLVAAVVYALFENRLPALRAQWVAVALLVAWWGGYLLSAVRYRWRA